MKTFDNDAKRLVLYVENLYKQMEQVVNLSNSMLRERKIMQDMIDGEDIRKHIRQIMNEEKRNEKKMEKKRQAEEAALQQTLSRLEHENGSLKIRARLLEERIKQLEKELNG